MIKELFGYIGKQPSYSEGSACATPTAMPTITTADDEHASLLFEMNNAPDPMAFAARLLETLPSEQILLAHAGQWQPTPTYDDCGIPIDDDYPARFMQHPPERPRHEDKIPIYRWQSNVKDTDFWEKINDAAGDDCISGDFGALIGAGRMMVSIHMSQCHSDEDLLKIFGAHPRR